VKRINSLQGIAFAGKNESPVIKKPGWHNIVYKFGLFTA
jgi:hypothetical protein